MCIILPHFMVELVFMKNVKMFRDWNVGIIEGNMYI
jgi:hypothetical protein